MSDKTMTPDDIRNMKAGPELDAMVAEKFLGRPWSKPTHGPCCTCQTCGHDKDWCACGWSENEDKAWELVEKIIRRGLRVDLSMTEEWQTCEVIGEEGTLAEASWSTWPVAVSKCAALLAVMEGE